MAKRPFLLLYINDFLSSVTVMAMDDQQFAWYLKLLMRAWQNEPACHLPNNDDELMMMAGCKIRKIWDRKKRLVLSNFDVSEDKNWLTNARLIGEYVRMCQVAETKAEAGRRSAAARQQKLTSVEHPLTAVEQNSTTQTSDVRSHTQTKEEPKPKAKVATLPDWIPLPTWNDFVEMRKKIRKPLTEAAQVLIVKKLENLQTRGHPVKEVLEQSILNSYQGVWEIGGGKVDGNHGDKHNRNTERVNRHFADGDC